MSFYQLPNPYNPGYAIPEYVMAEPPERGTFTTAWMTRGTIPALVPDYLAKPGRKLLGRNNAELGSLAGTTLTGNTLKGSTLTGHSLQGTTLDAEPATPAAPSKPPVAPSSGFSLSQNQKIALGAGVAVAAYLLLRKKRR